MSTHDEALLAARDIRVHFASGGRAGRRLRAVDGVGLQLHRGKTLGLVGESGCGKTTLARAIAQLQPIDAGEVRLGGRSLAEMTKTDSRVARRRLQMVFQDPGDSLHPRFRVRRNIEEPLRVEGRLDASARRERCAELMELVGLNPSLGERFPHMLSGGQQQRVAIARALATNPDVVVCDEAVSALDVSVKAQVINLLERLQEELGLAYLFIAHDLAAVRHISHYVVVMYLGRVVEQGEVEQVFALPSHPYTQALIAAVPSIDPVAPQAGRRIILAGDPPDPSNPPSGCRFRTRCPYAQDVCARDDPPLRHVLGHDVACHFAEDLAVRGRPQGDRLDRSLRSV